MTNLGHIRFYQFERFSQRYICFLGSLHLNEGRGFRSNLVEKNGFINYFKYVNKHTFEILRNYTLLIINKTALFHLFVQNIHSNYLQCRRIRWRLAFIICSLIPPSITISSLIFSTLIIVAHFLLKLQKKPMY